jgi:hypothetical protein
MTLNFFAASYEVAPEASAQLGAIVVHFADGTDYETKSLTFARLVCVKAALGYSPALAIEAAEQQMLNAAVQ